MENSTENKVVEVAPLKPILGDIAEVKPRFKVGDTMQVSYAGEVFDIRVLKKSRISYFTEYLVEFVVDGSTKWIPEIELGISLS